MRRVLKAPRRRTGAGAPALLRRAAGVLALTSSLAPILAITPPVSPATAAAEPAPSPEPSPTGRAPMTGSSIPPEERDTLLPKDWRSSADMLWTTSGDPTGLHLLVAEARSGYTWRTVTTLSEPGFDTDRWIGNVCLSGSGKRAVVVYAPRQFTNRERLFGRGAFAAVVDIATGAVTKLPVTVSLAYYNPGCGTGETAVLTQSGLSDFGKTRLHVLDLSAKKIVRRHELTGQVTSAVPVGDRIVAAAGAGLVEVDREGRRREVARTGGTPFELHPDGDGGVAFLEARGDTTTAAMHLSGGTVREIAKGPLTEVGLTAGTGGRIFLTGRPEDARALPATWRRLEVPARAEVSTHGVAMVAHHPVPDASNRRPASAEPRTVQPARLEATLLESGRRIEFHVTPGAPDGPAAGQGHAPAPGVFRAEGPAKPAAQSSASADPVDRDRTCSVPRNDSRLQVYQPHWEQVEWAADLAVQGALGITRPANWKGSGLPSWTIQGAGGMFPRHGLYVAGEQRLDHRIPAQIMLGILAQESNLWQASPRAMEGVYGNPLVGNFYGLADEDDSDSWSIRWHDADCGYGVAQITDGMRQGDPARTAVEQRIIAVDYASNIAAGVRILEEKWNQTARLGITVNSGNPQWIENWFSAVWAYNTGVQPGGPQFGNTTGCLPGPSCHDGSGNWGLGWANNPINPEYPANRKAFLDTGMADAAHPQDRPYPEKVMGWAAYPIVKENPFAGTWHSGYRQAWWTHAHWRTLVKPPRTLYCRPEVNHCHPDRAEPCARADFHCWWNQRVEYKPNCLGSLDGETMVSCGQENMRFSPGTPEPPDWNEWFRPNCSLDGLPTLSTLYIIDDVSHDSPRGCPSRPFANQGTFTLDFAATAGGDHLSKIDFHQLGGGFNGHFWFAHSWRRPSPFRVTGTWRLNRPLHDTWAQVFVHIPDHGSKTQQARYDIDLGDGRSAYRVINAKSHWREQRHRWVSLGVFRFNGVPEISLSNLTPYGEGGHPGQAGASGVHNVAWDAVAIQPLPRKPANFVVHLGDSFASGEGAVNDLSTGEDYDRESDMDGDNPVHQNKCHRSKWAWIRQATLPDEPGWMVRGRESTFDDGLDFHMLACSGARTFNLLPYGMTDVPGTPARGQHGEVSQLETGHLDANTTLVTLSIGGNDARWADVIEYCMYPRPEPDCQDTVMPGDTVPLAQALPERIRTEVIPSIQRVVEQIHAKAPNAKIVLMGYPRLFSGNLCMTVPIPLPGVPPHLYPRLSNGEVAWLNQMADHLAEQTNALTERLRGRSEDPIGVWFGDPRDHFAGRALCSENPLIHWYVLTRTPGETPTGEELSEGNIPLSAQSFHPNIEGALHYSYAFQAALAAASRR